jgi:putative tryptophan/tyrosine transport system substrate-binding protein
VRRRDLLCTLAAVTAVPFGAAAQPGLPTIGYLSSNSPEVPVGEVAAFKEGLAAAGFDEARNVLIHYRFAEGNYDRLPAFAAELVDRPVDVTAASGLPAATVVTQLIETMAAKQLQWLHELVPGAALVGFLVNPKNPNSATLIKFANAAAASLSIEILPFSAVAQGEIEAAFAAARERDVAALLIDGDAFLRTQSALLVRLAAHYSMPAIYAERDYVAAGGLISYGSQRSEMRRQAGVYVGRILKGAKPAELPVMQPTKFELVINLKTAMALGLTVPQSLLLRADEVIE